MRDQEKIETKNRNMRTQRPAGTGRGRGRGGGFAAGPGGVCHCPNCGEEMSHHLGVPCNQTKCPNCGAYMVRK
jgi:hypothetical protein